MGLAPPGLAGDLPGKRLQDEHSLPVIRDEAIRLEAGGRASTGFFWIAGRGSSRCDDARRRRARRGGSRARRSESADRRCARGRGVRWDASRPPRRMPRSSAPHRSFERSISIDAALRSLFSATRRHEGKTSKASSLSFFYGDDRHVVLRAERAARHAPPRPPAAHGQHACVSRG